jgi:membrane protein required for colicin V production
MAIADIIVLVITGLSLLLGLWRGLVKEALSLAFWIAAVVLAVFFNRDLAAYLGSWVVNPALQRIVAFVVIFVLTVFVGGLLSTLVSKLTSAVGLGAVDRTLGGLFGFIRGVVIVTLGVMLTRQFEPLKPWYSESQAVPYLLELADYFRTLLEENELLPAGNSGEDADDSDAGLAGLPVTRGVIVCVA